MPNIYVPQKFEKLLRKEAEDNGYCSVNKFLKEKITDFSDLNSSMFKKKRGFILDWIWFAFTVLLIIICFIIGSYFVHEFNIKAQASDMTSEAKSISADNASNFSVVYDWIYVGLFFGLGMIIIFSFYLLNSHPALFIPLAILILFIIVIVAVSGNIYDRFSESPQLASTVSDFQYSDYLMDHIVELVLGMSMIGLIVMFIKLGEG